MYVHVAMRTLHTTGIVVIRMNGKHYTIDRGGRCLLDQQKEADAVDAYV